MLGRRGIIGLAFTQRSVTAVEVVPANGGGRAVRAAEFVVPADVDREDPAALGDRLRAFLKDERFSSRRCVIGMEATWLTAREKTLPPGAAGSLRDILAIAIEREFASDRGDLLFDYVEMPATDAGQSILLVAAPRRQIVFLRETARAAGLSVRGITSSTVALACSGNGSGGGGHLVLHLFPGGAELAGVSDGVPDLIRRLPVPISADEPVDGCVDGLVDELRRVLALLPGESAAARAGRLLVWSAVPFGERQRAILAERLDLTVGLRDRPRGIDTGTMVGGDRGGRFSAAAAVAAGMLGGRSPAVDFANSRLAPPKESTLFRKITWAAVTAVALLAALIAAVMDWRADLRETADMESRLAAMAPDIERARKIIDRTSFARNWYDRRPAFMDCLYRLTLLFPPAGGIWVTTLTLEENMQVVIAGKADRESTVLALLDGMTGDPRFTGVKPLYLRRPEKGGREISFGMSCRFEE